MQSSAKTVAQYLERLPKDRRLAISKVRDVILKNLPAGYEESINWGMISYEIPLSRYPNTYNKQPLGIVALANQKNYMALYLMGVYAIPGGEQQFKKEYQQSGKKLDMGKSCLRFKSSEDLPLNLIAKTVAAVDPDQYIKLYEASRKK